MLFRSRVFIASDHGFRAAGDQIFYANVWLEQQGYFAWKEGTAVDQEGRLTLDGHAGPETLIDWSRTVAFAMTASSNGIWIRRKRNGQEGVSSEEYLRLRQRLIDGLQMVADPAMGGRIIERVMTREEAFPGVAVEDAPDLTLVLRDHSFLSVLRADVVLRRRRLPYGTHHPDGIFMAAGPGIRRGAELAPFSIVDITPTLLHTLGLPLPSDLDGAPNTAVFEAEWIAAHPVRHEQGPTASVPLSLKSMSSLGTEVDEEVLRRLKALGYLE